MATALAVGTVLESIYDTPTSQYYVYRSLWFHLVLGALGVNIFCVAISRWPWKARHIPFLLAHAGILMLLGGAWGTEQFGLDGNLRVAEGETASAVELGEHYLIVSDQKDLRKVSVPWVPPGVRFSPISLKSEGLPYDLTIDKFYSHADASFSFIPLKSQRTDGAPGKPAIQLRLQGGPMNLTQDFWLWTGDGSFKAQQMGPAAFGIGADLGKSLQRPGRPSFVIVPEGRGFRYEAVSSDGKHASGKYSDSKAAKDQVIRPGWKGDVRLTVLDWIPDAQPLTHYADARVQYGQQAPLSAIHVSSGAGGDGAETWLGVGDRALLHTPTGDVEIGYMPQRITLPFGVRLDRFQVDRYEGSMDPASYSSRVTVYENPRKEATGDATISMNEPLTVKGITLYQASYEDAQPRPTVSIFSVNRDPGRTWKYLGSLLLVLGSILLFGVKYRKAKGMVAKGPKPAQQEIVL